MLSYRRLAVIASLVMAQLPLSSRSQINTEHSTLNVVLLGDSNTWLGGDDCSKPKGWNTWFAHELQPASCHSYARSGATWTNTPQTRRNTTENIGVLGNDNVIYNQICRLAEATDSGKQPLPHLIIILAGTNDAWFCDQRPQAFSTPYSPEGEALPADTSTHRLSRLGSFETLPPNKILTLQESVHYGCLLLQAYYPDTRIVLVTPPQTTAVETELIHRTGNIIEQVGSQLAIPVIRLDHEGCIDREQELQHKRLTYDGTHTSEEGARCIGHLIATRIVTLNK